MPGGRPAKYWSNEDMQLLVDLRDGDMKLFREIQEGHFPRRSLQAIRRRYYTAKDLGFRTSRVGARPEGQSGPSSQSDPSSAKPQSGPSSESQTPSTEAQVPGPHTNTTVKQPQTSAPLPKDSDQTPAQESDDVSLDDLIKLAQEYADRQLQKR